MSILEQIKEQVIAGNVKNVKKHTDTAVAQGLDVSIILNDGLIAGMNVIGALFKNNEVYVPEVLMAARAMHTGLAVIKPLIVSACLKEKGVVAIGTVKGDMHDIGKNLVIMMLEGAGYKVIDLGVDVPVEKFIGVVEEQRPQRRGGRGNIGHLPVAPGAVDLPTIRPAADNVAVIAEDLRAVLKHLHGGGLAGVGVADEEQSLAVEDDAARVQKATIAVRQHTRQQNLVRGEERE
jgi:hypothetical protein